MGGKQYKSLSDEVEALGASLERLRDEAAREAVKTSPRMLGILANVGVDGKLTGGDVIVSGLALLFLGVGGGLLWGLAKAAEGYSARDAIGCGTDVFSIVLMLVIARAVLDILSVPAILGQVFEIRSVLPERSAPADPGRRDPIFINRDLREDPLIGLPNGEVLRQSVIRDFLEAVDGQKGTVWSREEWCNEPSDKKRPGRGVMSQDQWRGLKLLIEEAGVWRSPDLGGFAEGFK
jgi:hypothetical protein